MSSERGDPLRKLNLASSTHGHPDWINVDSHPLITILGSPCVHNFMCLVGKIRQKDLSRFPYNLTRPPNFRNVNLGKGQLPFHTDEMQFVYCSHFIEHLPRDVAVIMLGEIFRILQPGGVVRLVTPDLHRIAMIYVEYRAGVMVEPRILQADNPTSLDPYDKINGIFSMKRSCHRPIETLIPVPGASTLWGAYQHLFGVDLPHQWIYDFDDLQTLLTKVGFVNIEKLERGAGKLPNLDFLDLEKYQWLSLYVEASKPTESSL